MNLLNDIKEIIIRLFPIALVIVVAIVCSYIGRPTKKEVLTTKRDTIVTTLKDSIKHLKVKENEEINIIRNANNDSTIIIFKRLIAE